MSKKILFIVNVDWFFVSHRLPIALSAIKEGYEVHIACDITDKGEYLTNLGLKVHPLPFSRSGKNIFSELNSLRAIYKLLKNVKPDLVHAVTIKPVLYGGIISRVCNVRAFVGAVSGLGLVFIANDLKTKAIRIFVKALYKLSFKHRNMKAIFQNEVDKSTLINSGIITADDTILIKGSGADLSEYSFSVEDQGTPKVIMAARLLKEKGVLEFISMARTLKEKGVVANFLLVGEPDYGNPNSFTANDLVLWKRAGFIELVGFSNDIPKLFSQSHVVVLPSFYGEGLPKVLIEAAACGRPIVTTNNPGCREAVIENETGFIVPIKDVDALSASVLKLIEDKALRIQMGLAAREFAVKEFDVRSVVKKHLEIYKELLE
jgi:glycosyltransferase involved in cell wall biosynthesis